MAIRNEEIVRFIEKDIGGILITDAAGRALYEDEKTAFIAKEKTNWQAACPPPREGQRAEVWDLVRSECGKTYMVITSAFSQDGELMQMHYLVDTSLYMDLYRNIAEYTKAMKEQRDHDSLTGLYNRAKFTELKNTLFIKQEVIAVFSMDVNNLKHTNDTLGHEAGDRLLRKAAESLRQIEARNVLAFRTGGDEFAVAALHMTRQQAEALRDRWAKGLLELNRNGDGIECSMACGFVYGEKGFDLEALLAQADQLMYENKRAMKAASGK